MRILFIILVLAEFVSCELHSVSHFDKLKGQSLPVFKLELVDKTVYQNHSGVTDSSYVLFYFGTDCPHCRAQTKEIIASGIFNRKTNFYFITYATSDQIKAYYDEFNLGRWRNVVVGRDSDLFLAGYYDIKRIPFVLVFDRFRKLQTGFIGEFNLNDLRTE